MRTRCLVSLALFCCAPSAAMALDVPPLSARVNDNAGLLTAPQRAALEEQLRSFEQRTQRQYAVLTLPSLEGDPIEDFSMRVVEAWKLGGKGRDDGLLLLVAVQDRKMRIEVGYGLEGDVPDALAARVIREVLAPAFREQAYYDGIAKALDVLMRAGAGEAVELEPSSDAVIDRMSDAFVILLVLGIFIFIALVPKHKYRSGPRFVGSGWSSGGSSGFSSRGFSGGGGRFGGGGASGGW